MAGFAPTTEEVDANVKTLDVRRPGPVAAPISARRVRYTTERPRRRAKVTGRAVLLWALCLYAVAQVGMAYVKDRWKALGPRHAERKWEHLLARDSHRPLAIMLGSSRVCWDFQAGRLCGMLGPDGEPLDFFNFGVPATGAIHEYLYLRDMLARGIRPKLVLVEYVRALLGEAHGTWASEENFTPMPWTSARDLVRLQPYFSRHARQRNYEWIGARVAPCYYFRIQLETEFLDRLAGKPREPVPDVDQWGACVIPPTPSAEKRAAHLAETRDAYSYCLAHFRAGAGPARALRDLADLCRRENLPVVFVIMPESSEFRGWYADEALAQSRELLAELCRRCSAEVIDASEWIPDEEFDDGHHVLLPGAVAFTNRLGAEVQRILTGGGAAGRAAPPRDELAPPMASGADVGRREVEVPGPRY